MNRFDELRSSLAAFEKIDTHLHFNSKNPAVMEICQKYRFSLVTVHVEFPEFGTIAEQHKVAEALMQIDGQRIRYLSSFSTQNWESSDWLSSITAQIEQDILHGALGVKIWKNIGMSLKDSRGKMVFIDDERLDPLFNYFENEAIPVMMHQGEPKNCWLPLEKMTMKYDREYFEQHPQYHFFLHPKLPSYQQLLEARDRRLNRNRNLKTIQAHLGSMEWNVDLIAEFLERFPNATVDTAARMNHLMLQTQQDRTRVRDFFIRYQDRILYGTDFFITDENRISAAQELERLWLRDWEFLSTKHSMQIDEFDGSFLGLDLPESVLKKIYALNAERFFDFVLPHKAELHYV